jgi:hypothetical protein
VAIAGSSWFSTRLDSSIRDLFDVCDQNPEPLEAGAHARRHAGGTFPAGGLAQQVAEARAEGSELQVELTCIAVDRRGGARTLVSHHGRRIWAQAETDNGAAFFFTLGDSHARAG